MKANTSKRPTTGKFATMFLIVLVSMAFAVAHAASLPGSDFEIDNDTDGANLKVDDAAPPSLDWGNVDEEGQSDDASGSDDDAFGQGAKEDTEGPAVVSGSIPPNKSDLLTFGVYLEDKGLTGKFLHVYWVRVQDPSGTTLMDFEFNQGTSASSNGFTPARQEDDLLLQYELAQGGTVPDIFLSRWRTNIPANSAADCEASNKLPCWSAREALSDEATGSINTILIPEGESAGLGALDPRTFGEASIDFDALLSTSASGCTNFGSAHLKSRSSDSFTAALKDFIKPKAINVSNCAGIEIIKQDNQGNTMDGIKFDLFMESGDDDTAYNPGQDTATPYTCTTGSPTSDSGSCLIGNILAGTYWVVEDSTSVPAGYDPVSSPQPLVIVAGDPVVQVFEFVNDVKTGTIRIDKVTDPAASVQSFTFNPSWKGSFTMTDGDAMDVSPGLLRSSYGSTGNYSVTESAQSGWTLTSAGCVSDSRGGTISPASIDLQSDEIVTCTFNNAIQLGTIKVIKQTDPDDSIQPFTFNPNWKGSFTLADNGEDISSGLLPTSEYGGNYSVTESDQPGWDKTGASCVSSTGSGNTDPTAINLKPGETVTCTFNNSIKRGTITVKKETSPDGFPGSFDFNPSWKPGFSLSDDGSNSTPNLLPSSETGGNYSVSETVPSGWNLSSASCVSNLDGSNTDESSINLRPNETVTCTFNNSVKRGAILITKTRKHAAATNPSADPHQGVTFTTSGGSLTSDDVQQTNANGQICVDGLIFSSLTGIGDYSVVETVPTNYVADGDTTKTVSVTVESTCGDNNEATVSFGNTPLTNISVSVDSLVAGGTNSTISCVDGNSESQGSTTTPKATGDATLDLQNMAPDTYVCTIVVDP